MKEADAEMNEGDPSYLRSRANRYRRLAKAVADTATHDKLNELAGELESDAARSEQAPHEPGTRAGEEADMAS